MCSLTVRLAFALAFGLLGFGASPQAATLAVGAGKTYSTIHAAIYASVEGDTILVYSGTYAEHVMWNKRVNIIEAPGATAALAGAPADDFYIHATGQGPRVWSGIDIHLTTNTPGACKNEVDGLAFDQITLNDEGGTNFSGASVGFVSSKPMTLSSSSVHFTQKDITAGIVQLQNELTGEFLIVDCDIRTRGPMVNYAPNGELRLLRTKWVYPENGQEGTFLFIGLSGPEPVTRGFVLDHCEIRGGADAAGLGFYHRFLKATNCVFEFSGLAINAPGSTGWHHEYINCAYSVRAQGGFIPCLMVISGERQYGSLVIDHMTFTLRGGAVPTAALVKVLGDHAIDLTLRNSILYLPGSLHGLCNGTLGGTLIADHNLRFGYDPNAVEDELTGTIITADPLLEADWMHLRPGSPAIDAGIDTGVCFDFERDRRGWGLGVDLGADEATIGDAPAQIPGHCSVPGRLWMAYP